MTNDMTEGKLFPIIIRFTIPLVLGNLLQLTYNAADSMIVGKFVGDGALAAVGTSNPLMTLLMLFVQGICLGASVLIGVLYGAKDYEHLQKQVSTAMISGCVFSVAMSVVSILAAPWLLQILQVDEVIMEESIAYLRIVMAGLIFNFIYNFFASTLRSMGDSKSPLLFLSVSAVLNIFGDLFFVIVLSGGIIGCAVSTVISEAISGLLCWIYIKKEIPVLNLGKKWLVFEWRMLKETLQYGFVSAMQQSTVQMGKLGIQAIVNSMGVTATATFNAVNRIDDYAIITGRNISNAMTSVMAQNRGAGKSERVRESFSVGMIMETIYGILAGIILYVFAEPILKLFTNGQEVVTLGTKYIHLIAFMYFVPGITNGLQGYFRGMGDLKVTLWSSIINMSARVISCVILVFVCKMGMIALPWSYLCGWIAMLIYEAPALYAFWKNNREK